MAKIPIWPGSSSFDASFTPFSFYDADTEFQSDAPIVATWCASRLGYPLVDIELQAVNDRMHSHFYDKAGYLNSESFVNRVKWFD